MSPRPIRLVLTMLPAALLAGCAGVPQRAASRTPVDFYDEGDSAIQPLVEDFAAGDGVRLRFVHYPPERANGVRLVYLNGIESHAGWFEAPARELAGRGYELYLLDRRGSGLNQSGPGLRAGHVDHADTLIGDIHTFRAALPPDGPLGLVALSWGGKLAVGHALRHPADFDFLVLVTPGLVPRVDVTPAQKIGILFAQPFRPTALFQTPIEPWMFTRNPHFLARIERDPLRLREATARFLWESRRLDRQIESEIGEFRTPVLLLLAGDDVIIDNAATAALLARGQSPLITIRRYPGLPHSLQFEIPAAIARAMDEWITGLDAARPGSSRGSG